MNILVHEQVQRTITVAPQDRLDAFSAPALRNQLEQLAADGVQDFIIDLSATPFMDSAGMAVLVSLLRRSRQAGGSVKLVWPRSEAVRRTLKLTQFDRIFEFVEPKAPPQ
jgi:anti-sigma B factor antagonist